MPRIEHVVTSPRIESFRCARVEGMFDVPASTSLETTIVADLPDDTEEWQIGLIVGPSGAGKTTIGLKAYGAAAYHSGFDWPSDKSILDGFQQSLKIDDIIGALSSVGFSSPPAWRLPYKCLSNGQKFRADLARIAVSESSLTVIDEFTSVVDRNAARIGSAAFGKMIRRMPGKRIVVLCCHYDVADWLEPDWVFDFASGSLTRGRLQRPKIAINVHRCSPGVWPIFARNHYMSADLSKAAECWAAIWEGAPVGFIASLRFPMNDGGWCWREHRLVCLPDFQGIGIGSRISSAVAKHYRSTGKRYFSTSSHPALYRSRLTDRRWKLIRGAGHVTAPGRTSSQGRSSVSAARLTASFEFIGDIDKEKAKRPTHGEGDNSADEAYVPREEIARDRGDAGAHPVGARHG